MKKKIIVGTFLFLFTLLFNISMVKAGCTISVSGPSAAKVGSNFNVSVTVPSNSGSWEYVLSYDSSKVKLVSGNLKVVGVYGDSRTSSYTFKALSEGSASFKATNGSIYDYDSVEECYSGSGVATVRMSKNANDLKGSVADADKSKDNYLKSLAIDSYELSPAFDKDTLEYNVTVSSDVEKITIDAEKNDKKAKLTGIGEVEVKEGTNKIEVVVTAENGDVRTYVINVTVEEKNPIRVKVGNKTYTVVRKEELISNVPYSFEKTTIKINGEEVIAYKNKKLNITIIGLQDSKKNVSLFIYDESKRKYEALYYIPNDNGGLILLDSAPKNFLYVYQKTSLKYLDTKYPAYKYYLLNDNDKYLVYGINLQDNKKGFYIYDDTLGTYIRYSKKSLAKDNLLAGLILLLGLIIIIKFLCICKKVLTSKEKKIEKLQKKISKLKDEDFEEDEEPSITQIEDEEPLPKKSRKAKRQELIDAKKVLDKDKPKSVRKISLEPDDMDDYDF